LLPSAAVLEYPHVLNREAIYPSIFIIRNGMISFSLVAPNLLAAEVISDYSRMKLNLCLNIISILHLPDLKMDAIIPLNTIIIRKSLILGMNSLLLRKLYAGYR
jgi:hypothetical protein